jgi:hypothetical protein
MAARLWALRARRALLHRNIILCFWYSFLLEAEWIPGPSAAGRIRSIEKIHYSLQFITRQQSGNTNSVAEWTIKAVRQRLTPCVGEGSACTSMSVRVDLGVSIRRDMWAYYQLYVCEKRSLSCIVLRSARTIIIWTHHDGTLPPHTQTKSRTYNTRA